MARLCAAASAAVLALLGGAAGAIPDTWPKLPGDPDYYVLLKSIEVSEGVLSPPFDPRGQDFALPVQDARATEIVLTLELDQEKYDLMHSPDVFVDGVRTPYNPLQPIVVELPLNETPGPLERTIRVAVADPSGAGMLWSSKGIHDLSGGVLGRGVHEYAIHLRQTPEFGEALRIVELSVADAGGAAVASSPAFRAGSKETAYLFKLAASQAVAQLRVRCPDLATQVLVDGSQVHNGDTQEIDMTHALSKTVVVTCAFDDRAWVEQAQELHYYLKFEREASPSPARVDVIMESRDGYCQEGPPAGERGGWVCRSLHARPRIVVTSNVSDAEKRLRPASGGQGALLREGLPHTVLLTKPKDEFRLVLDYGSVHFEYPVTLLMPATCETLRCPAGEALKPGIGQAIAKERLCLDEECSEQDWPRCCQAVATCAEFGPAACPAGTALRRGSEARECHGAVCSAADTGTCCAPRANCTALAGACPAGFSLRSDAAQTECAGELCTASDWGVCCEESARCSSFGHKCQAGTTLRLDADSVHCEARACAPADGATCCLPRARCSALAGWPACPAGKALRHDAAQARCAGENCTESDLDVCCKARATCASARCGPGFAPRGGAAQARCRSDVCEEADGCCAAERAAEGGGVGPERQAQDVEAALHAADPAQESEPEANVSTSQATSAPTEADHDRDVGVAVGGAVGGVAAAGLLAGLLGGLLGTTVTTTVALAATTGTTTTTTTVAVGVLGHFRSLLDGGSAGDAGDGEAFVWLAGAGVVILLGLPVAVLAVMVSCGDARRGGRAARLLGREDASSSDSDADSLVEQGQALARGAALGARRWLPAVLPQSAVDRMFDSLDRDGDGFLTRADFEQAQWPMHVPVSARGASQTLSLAPGTLRPRGADSPARTGRPSPALRPSAAPPSGPRPCRGCAPEAPAPPG